MAAARRQCVSLAIGKTGIPMKDFLNELLAGGPDYRVSPNLGGAIFAPADHSEDAPIRFQSVANRIIANDGLGYSVSNRLTHRDSGYAEYYIDRMVINF
jgi:hypothetical protein